MSTPTQPTILFVPEGDDPEPALTQLVPTVRRFLAVDVETNALSLSDPDYRVRSIQLGSPTVAVVLSTDDLAHRAAARRMLTVEAVSHNWMITAHNASFDTQALVHLGVYSDLSEAWSRMVDTMILGTMIEPPMFDRDASPAARAYRGLKHQAATWCPSVARSESAKADLKKLFTRNKWLGMATTFDAYKTPLDRNGWAQVPSDHPVMVEYAADDVLDGANLAETLYPLAYAVAPQSAAREHRVARMCAEMECRGLRLDRAYCQTRLDEVTEVARQAETALAAMGLPNPSRGLGDWLVEHGVQVEYGKSRVLKDGVTSSVLTDSEHLARYAAASPEVAALIGPLEEWRLATKLASTYFGKYLAQPCTRIHPDIRTLHAATGRMSVANPSMQNAPRQGGVREAFIADEGMVLVSADFSSVEMRVAGAIAGDAALAAVYAAGDDPYWVVARQLHGPDATKDHRQQCKAVALGRLYGQGIAGLARTHGLTVDHARTITEAFDNAYPQLARMKRNIQDGALSHGVPCWTNALGRHQRIDPTMHYKGVNYLVQGLARDLLVDAMFRVEDAGLGGALWLPVHDELIIQAPEADAEQYKARLVAAMSTELYGQPIPAEGVVLGARWKKA